MSSMVISYPARAAIPASISSRSESGSAVSSCARTAGRSERHFLPKAFLLGSRNILWNASKSSSVSRFSTLSSSARISWKSERSGPPTIHPVLQGNLCLRFPSTLILLPDSASDLTKFISASTASSRGGRDGETSEEPAGQSARWTEFPVSPL